MNRKNLALLALLVVQIGLIALFYRPGKKTVEPVGDLLADLAPEMIERIVLTDDQGKLIVLAKEKSGWAAGEDSYPVTATKIESLLKKLSRLKSARLVTRTRGSHARLKVSDEVFVRKVELGVKHGDSKIFFLGTSPNYKTIHVRAAGDNEVYLAKDLSSWELQPDVDSWWENKYINLPSTDIDAVSLTNANGSFSIKRVTDDGWELEENAERKLSREAVQELLDKAGHISLTKYLGKEEKKEYGLENPAAVLTLKNKDKTCILKIGPKDKENNIHVVKSDQSPFYVQVTPYVVEHLLNKKASDLLTIVDTSEKQGKEDLDMDVSPNTQKKSAS